MSQANGKLSAGPGLGIFRSIVSSSSVSNMNVNGRTVGIRILSGLKSTQPLRMPTKEPLSLNHIVTPQGQKIVLQDVTNKVCNYSSTSSTGPSIAPGTLKFIAVNKPSLPKPQVSNTASDGVKLITPVSSALHFQSNALSATYSEGRSLPKIVVRKDDGMKALPIKSQVSNPSILTGATVLQKIPNRQKSLSLQKNKIASKAVLDAKEKQISPSEPSALLLSELSPNVSHETVHKLSLGTAEKPSLATDQHLQTADFTEDLQKNPLDLAADDSTDIVRKALEDMLPSNYTHHVHSIEPIRVYHTKEYDESSMFMAVVRVDLRTKDKALKWVKDYTDHSFTDWRVRRCSKENTKFLVFKKVFRCHNNTMTQYRKGNVTAHKKHTECQASLHVTIKNFNMTKSTDRFLKKYPAEIVIHHCHNHPLQAAENLKYRRPTNEVKEKFEDLFRNGHSPSSALHMHQYDLQVESGDEFFKVLADGLRCPNLQWCYNLYRRIFSAEYGDPTGEGMLTSLKTAVQKYNEDCGSLCASVQVFREKDIVVALCSPLMKRVHQLRSSGEMAFLDSGGCMDRQNNRVFTLLAPSAAGALPEGLIITSSESEPAIYEGLKMLMDLVPPEAFGGRGSQGPQIVMTDDQTSERNALKQIFPDIILLLCLFHVLQAMWRYLWDSKHKVESSDKLEIYILFRDTCYEQSEDEFKKKYESMLDHPKVKANSGLVKHFNDLYKRAPEWALAYRNDLLTRGNNTNNYSEATVRLMKDQIFMRMKAYSEVQMFDFFTTRLEAYFERRLANVLNGRQGNYWTSKHFIHPSKLIPLRCEKSSYEGFYLVNNVERQTEYIVDMKHEVCSCPVGRNGAPCKHQMAVVSSFHLASTQFLPVDLESKLALHKVMTTTAPPAEWYAPLKGGPCVSNPGQAAADTSGLSNTPPDDAEINFDERGRTTASSDDAHDVDGSESNVGFDQEKLNATLKKWEEINTFMINSLKSSPEVFVDAVDKFSAKFQRAKEASENQLVSALHTFNKQAAGYRSVVRKYININSNSVQRRKKPSLGGRKCTQQGRPPKSAYTTEHGYSQIKSNTTAWNKPPTKRTAIPHSLAHKVTEQSQPKKPRLK